MSLNRLVVSATKSNHVNKRGTSLNRKIVEAHECNHANKRGNELELNSCLVTRNAIMQTSEYTSLNRKIVEAHE
jgi:hypothetical protein